MPRRLTKIDKLIRLREAGNIERAHVLPHHGSYTVGKHSFDMALLLLALHPNPSFELLRACIVHDLGERYTGDVPHPAKMADGELARRIERQERAARSMMGVDFTLDVEEQRWLTGLDMIEFLLWCKDQVALGNANAAAPYGAQLTHLLTSELPPELKAFVDDHDWTRTPDTFPN